MDSARLVSTSKTRKRYQFTSFLPDGTEFYLLIFDLKGLLSQDLFEQYKV